MRDLVQLALPPKMSKPSAERGGQRPGDDAFNEILQLKHGKGGAMARQEAGGENAPLSPSPAFRIKFAGYGLATGLPIPASEAATEETGDGTGADVALADEIAGEAELLPPGAAIPEEEEAPESDAPEPAVVENLAATAPALPPAQAVAIAAAQGPRENGSRSQPAQTASGAASEITEKRLDAARSADRPALPPASATAQKGLPPVGNAPVSPDSRSAAVAETTQDGAARLSPLMPAEQATSQEGQSRFASRSEPAIELRSSPAPADESRQDMPRLAANVKVTESLSVPAPQVPSPATSVTNAIASAPQWMSFARTGAAASVTASSQAAEPVKLLTIQLNPAELGAVTAKLRLVGDQLTIELQVDRAEAYDRLSTDRETILKAVRALGIEVDKVTVQQPQAQGPVNARSDNSAGFNNSGRDANFSTPGDPGGRESGQAGARGGRDGQDEPGAHIAGGSLAHQNRDERGLYI